MRRHSAIILIASAAAAASISACDNTTAPRLAAVGGTTTANAVDALIITPGRATLAAGTSLQLSTNAPATAAGQVQWSSSNTTVATVSPSGLVNAVGAGTSIVSARYAFDTTRVATAAIDVTGGTSGAARNP